MTDILEGVKIVEMGDCRDPRSLVDDWVTAAPTSSRSSH